MAKQIYSVGNSVTNQSGSEFGLSTKPNDNFSSSYVGVKSLCSSQCSSKCSTNCGAKCASQCSSSCSSRCAGICVGGGSDDVVSLNTLKLIETIIL